MASILVTGMSGTGKSTVLAELARRGFETVDTDDGDWITTVDGEPLWREPGGPSVEEDRMAAPQRAHETILDPGQNGHGIAAI